MFIESIDVRDFRGIEATAAQFSPLTVIRGDNHNGKSSVAQAIQLAMTARAKGTDAQGRGANDKIRSGAKKAHINMILRGKGGPLPFGVSYGPGRTGRQLTTETPEAFSRWLALNTDRLCCTFDSDHFIRQKPEDQKSILASLVLPSHFDFPEDIRRQVAAHLTTTTTVNWDSNPVQLIETLYDLAYDRRKAANAEFNGIHIPELPERPAHTVEQIKAKLVSLRERQKSLAVVRPNGTVEQGRLEEQLHQARQAVKFAEEEIANLRTAISDADGDVLDDLDLKRYGRVAAHRKDYNDFEEQSQEFGRKIEDQRQVEGIYRDLMEEKTCPTCRQQIGEAFINARIREALEQVAALGELQRDLMRQQKELGDIAGAEKILAAHERAKPQKERLQNELAAEVRAIAEHRIAVQGLQAKIAQMKPAADAPESTSELDSVNAQITRVESELTPAIAYETAIANIDKTATRKRDLDTKITALQKLVDYFGKDGIKAALIKQHIDSFEDNVNGVLRTWGYRAKLSIEPYSFLVTLPSGATLPLKELSGSEEMMFAVALQTAISHHSKINTVVIDKADTFIDAERNRLFSCLNKLLADGVLDQAIVLVADGRTEAPQKEGVAYYAAQAGKLVKL